MTKRVSIVVCMILLVYFVFTSGLMFEATGSQSTNRMDTPFSIAMSNHRTSTVGIFNEDDRACMDWLMYESSRSAPVHLDYNTYCLVSEYPVSIGVTATRPAGKHYLFLSTDNIIYNRLVKGREAGLREYLPLPNLAGTEVAFSSGDAVVYRLNRTASQPIVLKESAILFMDVWAEPPIEYWKVNSPDRLREIWTAWWDNELTPHIQAKILPLLDFARKNGITVIFTTVVSTTTVLNTVVSAASEGWELHPELEAYKYGELVTQSPSKLDGYLKVRGIDTILYAGYATNLCVLQRDTGMRKMSALGYNTVLIEDCSLSGPEVGYTHEQAIAEINEWYGGTTTMIELESLLNTTVKNE